MKRFTKIALAIIMALIFTFMPVFAFADTSNTAPDANPAPVITSGNLIVVTCAETGQVLLNTANGKQVDPTCATKLMSAMVAYDGGVSMDASVAVTADALKNIGQMGDISAPMIGLRVGNVMTVRQLFEATLIAAANDACNVLAHYVSKGDINSFVDKMNAKAKELGCENTKFVNATGLYNGEAYTTVEDVAKIAAAFYRYNDLLTISSKPSFRLGSGQSHTKNYLLSETLLKGYTIPGAKGMIAGQRTAESDYCLITAAEQDGIGYIYVIMEAPGEIRNVDTGTREFPENNAYSDMKAIFNWYKNSFGYVELAKKGDAVYTLPVELGVDGQVNCAYETGFEQLMLKTVDTSKITTEIKLDSQSVTAPVEAGKVVGTVDFVYEGQVLKTINLVTVNAVPEDQMRKMFSSLESFLFGDTMKTVIKVILWIIVGFFAIVVIAKVSLIVRRFMKEYKKRKEENAKARPTKRDVVKTLGPDKDSSKKRQKKQKDDDN